MRIRAKMLSTIAVAVLLCPRPASLAAAQVSVAEALEFEAATIRENTSGGGAFLPPRFKGTLLVANNVPVDSLIRLAYGVAATELVGVPGWADERGERFDVSARAAEGSSPQDHRAMLRRLLEERFALRARRETREMPVYVLDRLGDERLGPNLRRAAKDCLPNQMCEGRIALGDAAYRGAQWPMILQVIGSAVDRRVIDQTGLAGAFDFELTFSSRGLSVSTDDSSADIFTAVRQQLGLRLETSRVPLEVLVIDWISRPTPN